MGVRNHSVYAIEEFGTLGFRPESKEKNFINGSK